MKKYISIPNSTVRRTRVASFGSGMNTTLDESILPIHTAKYIYNFNYSSGALTKGYGLKKSNIGLTNVKSMWFYNRWDFDNNVSEQIPMYCDISGAVWFYRNGALKLLDGVKFTSPPIAVNYRLYGDDVILMCSENENLKVWDGVNPPYSVPNSPFITSLTMHYERMFTTIGGERNAVWFSSDLDPTNWDLHLNRGGFIEVLDERGRLNKVLSYLNHIYIFRDYGISRLTAFAEQTDFAVSNLFVSSGKIYADTALLCGDRVLFLASDGFYAFDGLSTVNILKTLTNKIKPSPNANACYHDGKYFIALNLELEDGETAVGKNDNNALVVFDIKSGAFSILTNVDISRMVSDGKEIFAILSDGAVCSIELCGSIFNKSTKKIWTSGFIDFNTEKQKTLREIHINNDSEITLQVFSERQSKSFTVPANDGINRVRVNVRGKKLCVSIESNEIEPNITRPTVIFSS